MANYKNFTINTASTPPPWGAVEEQVMRDIINTLVVGTVTEERAEVLGHQHYQLYDTNGVLALDIDNTGEATFQDNLIVTGDLTVTGNNILDSTGNVMTFAAQVITFDNFPITPSAAPTTDYQVANKKYVDDNVIAGDLDIAGDSGTGNIVLSSQVLSIIGTANEIETSAASQTITIGLPTDVTITGDLTVNGNNILDSTGNVMTFAAQVVTFDNFPITPSSAPTTDYQTANKKYVDDQITAEDLDFAGDTGTGSVDLDSQSLTIAGTAGEIVTVAGSQTITIGLTTDVVIAGDLTVTGNNVSDSTGNVMTFAAQVITFDNFPITPSSAPTTDYQVANKKYVDDQVNTHDTFLELTDTIAAYTINRILFETAAAVTDSADFTYDDSGKIFYVNGQIGVKVGTPFQNITSASGDLAAASGLHVVGLTGDTDGACLVLEDTKPLNGSANRSHIYMADAAGVLAIRGGGSTSLQFGACETDLTYLYGDGHIAMDFGGSVTADNYFLTIRNKANAASMTDTRSSLAFEQFYYDGATPDNIISGKITVGTEGNWTSTASTQDAYMAFFTVQNGIFGDEVFRISSAKNFSIGTTDTTHRVNIQEDIDNDATVSLLNNNDSSNAHAMFKVASHSMFGGMAAYNDTYNAEFASKLVIYGSSDALAVAIMAQGGAGLVEIYTGGSGPSNKCTTWNADGNMGIGGTTFDATARKVLHMYEGTAPAAGVANTSCLWSQDDSGTSHMYVQDSAGNQTKISPHNDEGEWEYYSKNVNTGQEVRVNMMDMIRELEKMTGKNFIKELV